MTVVERTIDIVPKITFLFLILPNLLVVPLKMIVLRVLAILAKHNLKFFEMAFQAEACLQDPKYCINKILLFLLLVIFDYTIDLQVSYFLPWREMRQENLL